MPNLFNTNVRKFGAKKRKFVLPRMFKLIFLKNKISVLEVEL